MRSLIAVTASVAMLVAQVPVRPAHAEVTPPVPQVVTQWSGLAQVFRAFPDGGDPLSKQIASVIIKNPTLAADLVTYMRNTPDLTRAQKLAAEQGLAAAADHLGIKAADGNLLDDPWFIALALLALGVAICSAACQTNNNNNGGVAFVSAN